MQVELEPVAFEALSGWADDDHAAALQAFRRTAERHRERALRSRSLTPLDGFDEAAAASKGVSDARSYFETWFRPHRIGTGKLTAYYEPTFPATRERCDGFEVPLHRRPPDLVETGDPDMRFGRRVADGFVPYHDRGAIQSGALDGQGLELAWLRDRVDAFVIHIQGSALLRFDDGSTARVTYDAKSGHPYVSLGAELLRELRENDATVTPRDVTADVLNDWLRANPERQEAFLARNPSYIFFREAPDGGDGPVAAAKVPLTPGRSLAVDRTLHSFGLPFWIETEEPLFPGLPPERRLTIAQDTGSAIVGPARGDLFLGTGEKAGDHAAFVNHAASFTVLLPRSHR